MLRTRLRGASLACALAAYAGLQPPNVDAQAGRPATATATSLEGRISALLEKSHLDSNIALSIVDTATGKTVFTHRADVPQNPASNLKLLTAATALLELGPEYRTHTALYGAAQDGRISGGLCLKGQADPTLTRADFAGFAQTLLDDGIRAVDEVVIDGSYFDAQVLPPAFEQQPEESAPFRAAIAAVSVNANAYTLRLRSGVKEGTPVAASIDGAGYFELDNKLTTGPAQQQREELQITERDLGDRVAVSLRGTVPLRTTTLAVQRRVPSPLHFAGQVFIDALVAAGIEAPLRARVGACPATAPLIMLRSSPPLGHILARLGKDSDNFVAEMVLKLLGAERTKKPGRTSDGTAVVLETLRRLKLPVQNVTLVNGSGLFQGNLVTADLLSQLLLTLHRSPVRADFIAHLSIAGADGTLAKRLRSLPVPRIVRAKTGTLDDVIALSGYVLGPSPERGYVFSYLATGITGKQPQARELIDQIVTALASQLHKRARPDTLKAMKRGH